MPEYSKEQLEKSKHFQELVNQASDLLRAKGRRFVRPDEVNLTRPNTPSENSETPIPATTPSPSKPTPTTTTSTTGTTSTR